MSRRFLVTLVTILIIVLGASVAVFLAKGYRFSTSTGNISGTGIMSITSVPEQASVYLDGNLTSATNTNINSLIPKEYDVKIVKEGYITWDKKVTVQEGLVSEIKAVLFRSIPSVYPLTYQGVEKAVLSPDEQKIAFIVPVQDAGDPLSVKKSGVWVWPMSDQGLSFTRGNEPRQITAAGAIDFAQATLQWSPDSSQILVKLPNTFYLLDPNKLNDPPRNITATIQPTLKSWDDDKKSIDKTRLESIKDLSLRNVASAAAVLKWSPDETKLLYCNQSCDVATNKDQQSHYKVLDLETKKSYDMPFATFYSWLADSEHIMLGESAAVVPTPTPSTISSASASLQSKTFPYGKISIIEFDGFNKSEIYAGNFDPASLFVWPDDSRIIIISSFPIATASAPNFYGINLK